MKTTLLSLFAAATLLAGCEMPEPPAAAEEVIVLEGPPPPSMEEVLAIN